MSGSENSPNVSHDLAALNREKKRLRLAGTIVLALGLLSAGLLYWLRSTDSNLDQYHEALARAETHQMQVLYGASGGLAEDFTNALKRPGPQAVTIIVISGMIAAACFYLGKPLPEGNDSN